MPTGDDVVSVDYLFKRFAITTKTHPFYIRGFFRFWLCGNVFAVL